MRTTHTYQVHDFGTYSQYSYPVCSRPAEASAACGDVSLDVSVTLSSSRSNNSRDMRLTHFVTDDELTGFTAIALVFWRFAKQHVLNAIYSIKHFKTRHTPQRIRPCMGSNLTQFLCVATLNKLLTRITFTKVTNLKGGLFEPSSGN